MYLCTALVHLSCWIPFLASYRLPAGMWKTPQHQLQFSGLPVLTVDLDHVSVPRRWKTDEEGTHSTQMQTISPPMLSCFSSATALSTLILVTIRGGWQQGRQDRQDWMKLGDGLSWVSSLSQDNNSTRSGNSIVVLSLNWGAVHCWDLLRAATSWSLSPGWTELVVRLRLHLWFTYKW